MSADNVNRFDVVVVGAGIAGLGVGAILTREAGLRVLVLDRYEEIGGRLMCLGEKPAVGWKVDVGLHMIELGAKSSCTQLNERVGQKVEWGPFSKTVQIFKDGGFKSVAELVPMTDEDRQSFGALLKTIAGLTDTEIEAWDDRSLEEWLDDKVESEA
ncbi:MAG: NAD(P)-binding protein, partial [Thermodesulfobacteriota bacterium]